MSIIILIGAAAMTGAVAHDAYKAYGKAKVKANKVCTKATDGLNMYLNECLRRKKAAQRKWY